MRSALKISLGVAVRVTGFHPERVVPRRVQKVFDCVCFGFHLFGFLVVVAFFIMRTKASFLGPGGMERSLILRA